MPTVMVVDEETSQRHALRAVLQDEGFKVASAKSGREAVAKQKATPASVITLDMRMPQMDGIDVAREIRVFDSAVTIIGVTAYEHEYRSRAAGLDISDWIDKPIMTGSSHQRLLSAVRSGVSRAASRRLEVLNLALPLSEKSAGALWDKTLRQACNELWGSKLSSAVANLPEPEGRQFALLFGTALLLAESKVVQEMFSRVFFTELGDCTAVVRRLQEIQIGVLARQYAANLDVLTRNASEK